MMRITVAPLLAVTLLGCKSHPAGQSQIDPKSGYARLRPAILEAVRGFPADPSRLGACEPALTDVAIMRLDSTAALLEVPLPKAPSLGGLTESSTSFHMRNLERGDVRDTSLKWFEGVQRIGLIRANEAVVPKLENCRRVASTGQLRRSQCDLKPGLFKGDVVVFDKRGRPTCSVRLEIAGPTSASTLGERIGSHMERFVINTAERLFHFSNRPPKTKPAKWRFLERRKGPQSYRISINGEVVVQPTPSESQG